MRKITWTILTLLGVSFFITLALVNVAVIIHQLENSNGFESLNNITFNFDVGLLFTSAYKLYFYLWCALMILILFIFLGNTFKKNEKRRRSMKKYDRDFDSRWLTEWQAGLGNLRLSFDNQGQQCMVIHDPKGELYTEAIESERKAGVKVIEIDLVDPDNKGSWNPSDVSNKAWCKAVEKKKVELMETHDVDDNGNYINRNTGEVILKTDVYKICDTSSVIHEIESTFKKLNQQMDAKVEQAQDDYYERKEFMV